MSRPSSAWTRTFWGSQELKLPLSSRRSWHAGCLWTPPTELAEFRRTEVPQAYSMPVQAGILLPCISSTGLEAIGDAHVQRLGGPDFWPCPQCETSHHQAGPVPC